MSSKISNDSNQISAEKATWQPPSLGERLNHQIGFKDPLGFDQLCDLCARQEKHIDALVSDLRRIGQEQGIQKNRAEQALKLIDGLQEEVRRWRSNAELLERILTQALAEPRGYR